MSSWHLEIQYQNIRPEAPHGVQSLRDGASVAGDIYSSELSQHRPQTFSDYLGVICNQFPHLYSCDDPAPGRCRLPSAEVGFLCRIFGGTRVVVCTTKR